MKLKYFYDGGHHFNCKNKHWRPSIVAAIETCLTICLLDPYLWNASKLKTLAYSLPILIVVGHQWAVSTNIGYIQWLTMAKPTLKVVMLVGTVRWWPAPISVSGLLVIAVCPKMPHNKSIDFKTYLNSHQVVHHMKGMQTWIFNYAKLSCLWWFVSYFHIFDGWDDIW